MVQRVDLTSVAMASHHLMLVSFWGLKEGEECPVPMVFGGGCFGHRPGQGNIPMPGGLGGGVGVCV